MLVVCGKLVKEVFARLNAEGVGIIREVTVLEHVVDVIPYGLQKDACRAKGIGQHDVSDITLALGQASRSVLFAMPLRGQYGI